MEELKQIAHITHRVTFKPHSVLKCDRYNKLSTTVSEVSRKNLLQEKDGGYMYNGYLSPASRREIKKRLEVWLSSIELSKNLKNTPKQVDLSQVFPTFVTLTLPSKQVHSDQDIKKYCLERFIKWVTTPSDQVYKYGPLKGQQKSFGVQHYFWRAETQENGNIHFHILVDRFVPWQRIRTEWNKIVETLGYVTRYNNMQRFFYRKGFRIREQQFKQDLERYQHYTKTLKSSGKIPKDCPEVLKSIFKLSLEHGKAIDLKTLKKAAELNQREKYEFGMKNGFTNPNSTDIHGIENLKSITAYVIKYVSKAPKEKKVKLAPDEKIIIEDGRKVKVKYYIDTTTPPYATEQYLERTPIVTEFEDRRLRGNIWGTDKGLKPHKGESPVNYFIAAESETHRFMREDREGDTLGRGEKMKKQNGVKKVFKTVWLKDLFGNPKRTEMYCRDYVEPVKIKAHERFPPPTVEYNMPVKDYLDKLRSLSDHSRLERIKKGLGEFFEQINGEIIPIDQQLGKDKKYVRQDQVLKELSPVLHKEYMAHYQNVFNYLYGNAA